MSATPAAPADSGQGHIVPLVLAVAISAVTLVVALLVAGLPH